MAIFTRFFLRHYRPGKSLLQYSKTKKAPFQAIKTKSSRSRKINFFPKGITHGFWSKIGHFSNLFLFQAIQARKMSFTIFYNGKAPFWAIKTRSSKRGKIDIFQKGLTHGFGPEMSIFPIFFFRHYTRNMSFTIFQNEKTPFQAIKIRSSKSRKNKFFSKGDNPWFLSKNGHFSNFFFFQPIQARKMSFTIFQNEKTPFQAMKTRSSKKRKIEFFSKGDNLWFSSKNGHFFKLFFFFFRHYRPGKCLLRYSKTKKHLSRL